MFFKISNLLKTLFPKCFVNICNRINTWYTYFGFNESLLPTIGEYTAHSPTLNKSITYTSSEIWEEVYRVVSEDEKRKFTPGQNLYYNIPHFANPLFFRNQEVEFDIQEYAYIKKFNIPPANCIDEADMNRLVVYSIIDEELTACDKRMKEKNNGSR